jgi:hypothetical protein
MLPAIKQILPGGPAIMIFIGARGRVSSKALHNKGYSAQLQGRRPIKCRRDMWAGRLQGLADTAELPLGHNGFPQYQVVQQLWDGSTIRRVATV